MDEDVAAMMRRLTAEQMAQRFILDYLMRHVWLQLSRAQRLEIAERLLDASEQTGHLREIAQGDELMAVNLAEITERMQTSVDQFVGRALKALGDAEDAAAARRAAEDRDR